MNIENLKTVSFHIKTKEEWDSDCDEIAKRAGEELSMALTPASYDVYDPIFVTKFEDEYKDHETHKTRHCIPEGACAYVGIQPNGALEKVVFLMEVTQHDF